MGSLDKLKQADDQQQTTETLEVLTSTLPAVEQQLTKLTKAVANLTGFMKIMDEQQDTRLSRLTSQQPELRSTLHDDELKKRLIEIEKTLASMAETLSTSKAVRLPSGESVKQSELDSYSMMQRIENQLGTMSRASSDLADAVNARGRIVIDPGKLADHAVKVLDARLTRAVEPVVARVETVLGSFEERVSALGAQQLSVASQASEQTIVKAEAVVHAVRAAELRVEALTGRVTWVSAGRLGLALVPLAAVLLVVGGLTMGAWYALGLGPLLGWAWGSFAAAEAWWAKALIAISALGGMTGFGWVVWRLARKLGDEYARW